MRILQLLWSRLESYGGVQSYVRTLNAALELRGAEVFTYCLPSRNRYHGIAAGDEARRLPMEGFGPALARLVEEHKADVIDTHNVLAGFAPGVAGTVAECARSNGIRHVTTMHDVPVLDTSLPVYGYMQQVLEDAHVIVTSGYNLSVYRQIFRRTAAVIEPGIDFEMFAPDGASDGATIAYPGRLIPAKGAAYAIRLLGEVTREVGPLTLLLSDRSQGCFGETTAYFEELDRLINLYPLLTVRFTRHPDDARTSLSTRFHSSREKRGGSANLAGPH